MKNFAELEVPEFVAGTKYIAPMDCLIYLQEDCSYRAVRVDPYRTVLLHPYEDRPVGIKVKGARHVAERLMAILHSQGLAANHLELAALWETALTVDGERKMHEADADRRQQYAKRAKDMLSNARVDRAELPLAA